jgi:hypothetical protein
VVTPLIDDYYPDNFKLLTIHLAPPLEIPWGSQRWSFYYVPPGYIPRIEVDGVLNYIGYPGGPPGVWGNLINNRLAVPTDITIDVSLQQVVDQTFDIVANVCMEPSGAARTVRVWSVQLLDFWPAYAPPGYPDRYRNCVMWAPLVPQDIALAPDECVEVVETVTFDSDSWDNKQNIEVVVWAQEPAASPPAEVYQVGSAEYGDHIFTDGFESGDVSAWSTAVPGP